MSLKAKILPNYNYQDYCQWEGKWEVIEGIPFAMSPAPSPFHQSISVELSVAFHSALAHACCDCKVYQPIDLLVNENTILQPDLLIACSKIKEPYLNEAPPLVIEILSPASALKDRNIKFQLYQDFGIRYYIIIDPETQEIEIYKLNDKGIYELIDRDSSLYIDYTCIIKPDFSQIFN